MRLVVTGGAGFIGSHLVDRFSNAGHDVLVIDDLSSGKRENLPRDIALTVADIRSDAAKDAVRAFAPEVLVHEAAQIDVRTSVTDWPFDIDVNLRGFAVMLEGARAGGALEHVLFASSGGAMYGEQERFPADETHPVRPESPYGLAKATGEEMLALYERLYGVTYTALRYANVYGPRQDAHGEAGVVAIFARRLLAGEPCTVFGDGAQTRDFVFVDDVVEANARALAQRLRGGFNVGTGQETSVNALVACMLEITGARSVVEHAASRKGEQRRSVISAAKLKQATGFAPETPLKAGLEKTIAFFRR
jgi:UDP-glucose 4-epimerase